MNNFNDIFMKIDIEGHEFRLMPSIIENNLINKIKQLVIEIHSPAYIELHPNYFKGNFYQKCYKPFHQQDLNLFTLPKVYLIHQTFMLLNVQSSSNN